MFQNTLSMFLQLALLSFAMAEETLVASQKSIFDNTWKYGSSGGVIGFAILILDIIVFIEVLKSNRTPSHQLLWCLLVFIFPIVGLIIYWLFSNRAAHAESGSYEAIP